MSSRVAIALYVLLAACAVGTLLYGTARGPGVSADSAVYLGAAESWEAGQGLLNGPGPGIPADEPLTHYPPLYPLAIGLVAGDRDMASLLQASRWVAVLSLLVVLASIPLLMERLDVSVLLAAGFLFTGGGLLEAGLMVWSELPFLALLLFFFVCMRRALRAGELTGWGGLAGLVVSLLYLTRYAGAAAGGAGLLLMLWSGRTRLSAVRPSLTTFCAAAALGPLFWAVRNARVLAGDSSREIAWHPPGPWHLSTALSTLVEWLAPHGDGSIGIGALRAVMLVLVAAVCLWLCSRTPTSERTKLSDLTWICVTFVAVYLALVLVSACFMDALTPFDLRLMLPVYAAIVIGVADLAHASFVGRPRPARWVAVALGVGVLAGLPAQRALAKRAHAHGLEYSSDAWAEREVMEWLRAADGELRVLSNAPDAIYARTQVRADGLPMHFNPFSERDRASYAGEWTALSTNTMPQVVVYLDGFSWRREMPPEDEVKTRPAVRLLREFPTARVYSIGASGKVRGGGS